MRWTRKWRLPDAGCRTAATFWAPRVRSSRWKASVRAPIRIGASESRPRKKGGNVLLAISDTIVRRPNLDCPSNDTSPDCLRGAQSWYRVAFEEYACSPEAVERLAALPAEPDRGGITIRFPAGRKSASPALSTTQMKQKILRMMSEGLTPDVIATWVRGERLISRLSAEDLVEWKRAGIPDEVLKAAAER